MEERGVAVHSAREAVGGRPVVDGFRGILFASEWGRAWGFRCALGFWIVDIVLAALLRNIIEP